MTIRQTSYEGLGYTGKGKAWWFVDLETGAQIGAVYPSQMELLGDVRQFAEERGFGFA